MFALPATALRTADAQQTEPAALPTLLDDGRGDNGHNPAFALRLLLQTPLFGVIEGLA